MNAIPQHLIRFLTVAFLLIVPFSTLPARAADGPPAFDFDAFRKASDEERILTLVASLDAREESLQNFSYKALETCVNVRKDNGARSFVHKQSLEFKHLDDIFRLHVVDYGKDEAAKDVRGETDTRWDGGTGVRLTSAGSATLGTLDSTPQLWPNVILGVHLRTAADAPRPVVQWLRDAIHAGADIRADDQNYKGVPTLHLNVKQGDWRREFWLDPNRGFMTVALSSVYGPNWSAATYEVTAARQVGGVWMPTKIVGRQGVYYTPEQSESTYDLGDITVNKLKEADLALPIPADAEVNDQIRHIRYHPLPDGTFKLLPTFDDLTGDQYQPPAENIVPKIDDQTPRLYHRQHVGTLEEQLRAKRLPPHP
jgi:hypothetical protein